jgi:hypothetical protein
MVLDEPCKPKRKGIKERDAISSEPASGQPEKISVLPDVD